MDVAQFKVRWASDTIVSVRVVRKSVIGTPGECSTYTYALRPRVGYRDIAARLCACVTKGGWGMCRKMSLEVEIPGKASWKYK